MISSAFELTLYITAAIANAIAIETTETRGIQIGLLRNGSLSDTNNIPNCRSDQKIHLVSYMYHQLQCRFSDDCSSVHEEPLLPEEEFHLHQMCSMQQQCINLAFPLRSEAQRSKTNAIIIRYGCIDQKRLVNICEKDKKTFSGSVYLTSVDIKGPFKECQCFVNSGQFTISVTDIRLNDIMDNKCSPATLHINDKEFTCDKTRNDYGAIFTKSPAEPLSNAYISIVQNSETALPEMILMKLQPESSLRIVCQGQQTTRITTLNRTTSVGRNISTSTQPTTASVLTNDEVANGVTISSRNQPLEDVTAIGEHHPLILTLLIIMIVAIILMASTVLLRIYLRFRKKRRPLEPTKWEIGRPLERINCELSEILPLRKESEAETETATTQTEEMLAADKLLAKLDNLERLMEEMDNRVRQADADFAYSPTDEPYTSKVDGKSRQLFRKHDMPYRTDLGFRKISWKH